MNLERGVALMMKGEDAAVTLARHAAMLMVEEDAVVALARHAAMLMVEEDPAATLPRQAAIPTEEEDAVVILPKQAAMPMAEEDVVVAEEEGEGVDTEVEREAKDGEEASSKLKWKTLLRRCYENVNLRQETHMYASTPISELIDKKPLCY